MTHLKVFLFAFILVAFYCAGLKIGLSKCDNKKPVINTKGMMENYTIDSLANFETKNHRERKMNLTMPTATQLDLGFACIIGALSIMYIILALRERKNKKK